MSRFSKLALRWRSLCLAGAIAASLCPAAQAATPSGETEVKAAVVFNLLQFVQWPAEIQLRDRSLVLCAPEGGRIGQALAQYDGTRIRDAYFRFRSLDRRLEHVAECHAVFVEAGDPYVLLRLAASGGKPALLVIAEGDNVLQQGAGIGLALAGNRVVFDINLAALRAAGFTVSSKLLRLARSIVE